MKYNYLKCNNTNTYLICHEYFKNETYVDLVLKFKKDNLHLICYNCAISNNITECPLNYDCKESIELYFNKILGDNNFILDCKNYLTDLI